MANVNILTFLQDILKVDSISALALVGLGLLLKKGFACPCHEDSTFLYSTLLFCPIIIIGFLTMLKQIKNYKELQKCFCCRGDLCVFGVILSVVITTLTWLMVWYFEADYYVCAESNWGGVWTNYSQDLPFKWCLVANGSTLFENARNRSLTWFFETQVSLHSNIPILLFHTYTYYSHITPYFITNIMGVKQ